MAKHLPISILAPCIVAYGCSASLEDVPEQLSGSAEERADYPLGCDTTPALPITQARDLVQHAFGLHTNDCRMLGGQIPLVNEEGEPVRPYCPADPSVFSTIGGPHVKGFEMVTNLHQLWAMTMDESQFDSISGPDDLGTLSNSVFLIQVFEDAFSRPALRDSILLNYSGALYARRSACRSLAAATIGAEGSYKNEAATAAIEGHLKAAGEKVIDGVLFIVAGEFVSPLRKLMEASGPYGRALRSSLFIHLADRFNDDFGAQPLYALKGFTGILIERGAGEQNSIEVDAGVHGELATGQVGAEVDAVVGIDRTSGVVASSTRVFISHVNNHSIFDSMLSWYRLPSAKQIAEDFFETVEVEVLDFDPDLVLQPRQFRERVALSGVAPNVCEKGWTLAQPEPMRRTLINVQPARMITGVVLPDNFAPSTTCVLEIEATIAEDAVPEGADDITFSFHLVNNKSVLEENEHYQLIAPVVVEKLIIDQPRIDGFTEGTLLRPSTAMATSDNTRFIWTWRFELELADNLVGVDFLRPEYIHHEPQLRVASCGNQYPYDKLLVHTRIDVDAEQGKMELVLKTQELNRGDFNTGQLVECVLVDDTLFVTVPLIDYDTVLDTVEFNVPRFFGFPVDHS